MYLQPSRLQYNLQGIGVFQTAHSDKTIQAIACYFIISARRRNTITNCCLQQQLLTSGSTIIQDGKLIGTVTRVLGNDPARR